MSLKSAAEQSSKPITGRWRLATRLTIWYAGATFLLLLATAGIMYQVVVEVLALEDAEDLAEQISAIRKHLKTRPLNLDELREEIRDESSTPSFSPTYVRVLDREGRLLEESQGMSAILPVSAFPGRPDPVSGGGPAVALKASNGRAFRGRTVSVENEFLIQVAVDRAGDVKLLATCRKWLASILGVGLIVCTLVGYVIASRGVRPITEITATMRRIHSTTLNARVELPHLPAELSNLAATFNEMLDRLEEAFSRLSQFSADIAHDLRTPINNLRGETEVALTKTRSPEEYREVLGSCLEECVRLSRLIDNLLFLARAENPRTQIQRERLDLRAELATLRDFYDASAGELGVTLSLQTPESVTAEVDRTMFQRAVGNLIENALAHTPGGGKVTLHAANVDSVARVTVSDCGCGIPADQLPYIFERFRRVDSSRSKNSGGHGLGLAIVKSIITLHGGSVQIRSQPGVATEVTLQFPQPARL